MRAVAPESDAHLPPSRPRPTNASHRRAPQRGAGRPLGRGRAAGRDYRRTYRNDRTADPARPLPSPPAPRRSRRPLFGRRPTRPSSSVRSPRGATWPIRRPRSSLWLALRLERPLLIEGPAGVGKTDLARAAAEALGTAARAPAMLRGARRSQGALRVGLREADALHAAPSRRRRRRRSRARRRIGEAADRVGAKRRRVLQRAFPHRAPAPGRAAERDARGAAHRRGRSRRPRVRSVLARESSPSTR